jgi:Flp pilus assembly protein protease CpaA
MQAVEIFRLIVLAGMLCWATYADLNQQKIPNLLSLLGVVIGFALSMGSADTLPEGFFFSFYGMIAGAAPFLIFYWIGVSLRIPLMGAGDVKMMAAIGAFVGDIGALYCIFYGMMVAGVAALAILAYSGLRQRQRPKTIALGACLAIGTMYYVYNQKGRLDRPMVPATEVASRIQPQDAIFPLAANGVYGRLRPAR